MDDRDDDDEMMMMMTHGQQWAACVRCFLPAGMTHFLSCLLPSPATYLLSPVHFSRSDSRQLGMCAGTWRRQWRRGGDGSSSSKYIVQQHSRAQRQTNTYTEAAYGPGILPHPVQPPSFPFLFPLPLTPSPSHKAGRPPGPVKPNGRRLGQPFGIKAAALVGQSGSSRRNSRNDQDGSMH